mgnify:CR=1 FL=1
MTQTNIIGWAGKEGYSISYFLANVKETIMLFARTIIKKFDHYVFTTLGQQLGVLRIIFLVLTITTNNISEGKK